MIQHWFVMPKSNYDFDPFGSLTNLFKDPVTYLKKTKVLLKDDPSALVLFFSNVLFIVFAIVCSVSLGEVLFVYWLQSVIIGSFNILKILMYPFASNSSTRGYYSSNGKIFSLDSLKGRLIIAFFFVFHYGFFHFVYLIFIGAPNLFLANEVSPILIGGLIFFIPHLFSFFFNLKSDLAKKWDVIKLMFLPYSRILPMHITIIFGAVIMLLIGMPLYFIFGNIGVRFAELLVMILFTLIKMLVDLSSHKNYHGEN